MKYYRIETGRGPAWAREEGDSLRLLVGDPWTGTSDGSETMPVTLLPGDMISTGTPSGIGPLQPGDVVEIELEGVGVLRNPVL